MCRPAQTRPPCTSPHRAGPHVPSRHCDPKLVFASVAASAPSPPVSRTVTASAPADWSISAVRPSRLRLPRHLLPDQLDRLDSHVRCHLASKHAGRLLRTPTSGFAMHERSKLASQDNRAFRGRFPVHPPRPSSTCLSIKNRLRTKRRSKQLPLEGDTAYLPACFGINISWEHIIESLTGA